MIIKIPEVLGLFLIMFFIQSSDELLAVKVFAVRKSFYLRIIA